MKHKAKVFTLALLVIALFTALMLSACGKTDDKTPDDGVKTYTVTFVTDGGTEVPSQTISEGGKVVKPADPKKTATVSGKVVENELSDSPTLRTNDPGFALSWFNLDRSEVYYAEATFDSVDKDANNGRDWGIGLSHATDEDGGYTLKDYYRIYDWGNKWAHRFSRGWNADSSFTSDFYAAQGIVDPEFNVANKKITIGIARVGDVFYSFLNGQLTDKYVYAALKGRKTFPGICLIGNDVEPYPGIASNMKFVGGSEAETLIEKLVGEDNYYKDFGYARVLDGYEAATVTEDGFAFDKIENFDSSKRNWWNCAVKTNTYFGGNYKVEYVCSDIIYNCVYTDEFTAIDAGQYGFDTKKILMPEYVIKGASYSLDHVNLVKYTAGGNIAAEYDAYVINDGGSPVKCDPSEVVITANSSVRFRLVAKNDATKVVESDELKVIDVNYSVQNNLMLGKYFVGGYDGSKAEGKTYTLFTKNAQGISSLDFVNPLVTEYFSFTYEVPVGVGNYSVTLKLRGYQPIIA